MEGPGEYYEPFSTRRPSRNGNYPRRTSHSKEGNEPPHTMEIVNSYASYHEPKMNIELCPMRRPTVLEQNLLGYNFSSALKSEIFTFFFGDLGCNVTAVDFDDNPKLWKGYFRFYSDQCVALFNDRTHRCPVKSHRDFLEVVRFVLDPSTTREAVKEILKAKFPETESSERTLTWHDSSLEALLRKGFSAPRFVEEGVKLEKLFTAQDLTRIGGMKITWVNNLADHLLMHDDDNVVSIFHYASFLKLHQNRYAAPMEMQYQASEYGIGSTANILSELFPRDSDGNSLVEETLRTLALLLPPYNDELRTWFQKQAKRLGLDVEATNCDHLKPEDRQIEKFKYWHERLTILKETFDDAEPKSVKQWWRDRRKPVQWYNFWLAIVLIVGLTVVFGLIQSIEGALQVYKAYYPS